MKKTIAFSVLIILIAAITVNSNMAGAQPYGKGLYNEMVPYGNQTSLSISTSGTINVPITPTASGTLMTGTSNITVTSTDVKGYKLYIRSLANTYMDNLGAQLPASANVTAAALAVNTWGYNTDASSNFIGIKSTDALIRSATTPVPSGDSTSVTYGIKLDMAKPAGDYIANVVYTAVPQTN